MMPVLLESALRALLAALTVWVGLRLCRVGNVVAQKAAWGLVLAAALAMPLLMRWHWLPANSTVTLPIPAWRYSAGSLPATEAALATELPSTQIVAPKQSSPATPEPATRDRIPAPSVSNQRLDSEIHTAPKSESSRHDSAATPGAYLRLLSPFTLAWFLYLAVCAALLVRLLYGLGAAVRLWRRAKPVSLGPGLNPASALRLRASTAVTSPVTIASGVLLPEDYADWSSEKLRIVLAHERSHIRQGDFYLQFLAGLYAAIFWFSPLGWWLKRKLSDLGEAIGDRAGLEEAVSSASYAQVLLEFAALPRPTLIGVAMARRSNLSHRIEWLLNDSRFRQAFAGSRRRALLAALFVPVALLASTAFVRVQAAVPAQPAVTAQSEAAAPVIGQSATEPAVLVAEAPVSSPVGTAVPEPAGDPESASESTFDRTLTVNGKVELSVSTGSGNIHLTRGSANQVKIHGRVKSHGDGNEERARQITANPPIVQTGNIVRIGGHDENLRNISIDYEIEAPADAMLNAGTGTGNIADEGVGDGAKLETGSGNVTATGLRGGIKAETGSGNINIEETGEGDVKAETGSGSIDLKEVHGGLLAETGSGEIKVKGKPTKDWKLETGSGTIEFWVGDAPVTIDASTGSGGIHSDREMLTQGISNQHHITGKLNGGGPTVRMESGSGGIQIH